MHNLQYLHSAMAVSMAVCYSAAGTVFFFGLAVSIRQLRNHQVNVLMNAHGLTAARLHLGKC